MKATKGKKEVKIFYTLPEYESWVESLGDDEEAKAKALKKWKIKYYKGLGTSTAKEAKEYFGNLNKNMLDFKWEETDEELVKLAFSSQKRDERKTWISAVTSETYLDHKVCSERGYVKYSEFFDKEFVLFSKASVLRAIPNVVDGFKPSQRKVLFSCFKRKLHSEIKVAQLAGYVSEHGAYHHGEASLMSTWCSSVHFENITHITHSCHKEITRKIMTKTLISTLEHRYHRWYGPKFCGKQQH